VPSEHVGYRGSGGCITRDVERDYLDLDAGIGGCLVQAVGLGGVPHGRDDSVASTGECDRGAQADTRRAASNEYDGHGALPAGV
jgi:hypothetical protein